MWTPKRVILLAVGSGLFLLAYFVYAHFLGGIDGLPPLPEDYRPLATRDPGDFAPLPQTENSATVKLRTAFGVACKEIDFKIKLELQKRGLVLAAGDFKIDSEGRVLLFPFSLAIFGKARTDGQEQEINTVQSETALLTLDKPVNNVMEMTNRKIIGAELTGNIYLINNRRTPQRDDDISLFTQGPLFYAESLQLVWTDKTVRLIDPQSKPHPMTIDGTQLYVYLTKDTKPEAPPKSAPRQPVKPETVSGVDRIELRKDVDMNLWLDAHSGFLRSSKEADKQAKPPMPVDAANQPAGPEKVKVVIRTQGPFTYDLHTHRATFDISKISGPSPNVVTVDRINEIEGKLDNLQCDHLELQFRPSQEGQPKQPAENASEGLDLESARATGSEVVLTSDAEVLEAHGNDFFYDKIKGLSTLKGIPRMWAIKEGNQIEAPELQLLDLKGNQQATALGEGHIVMLDKATGKRPLKARWKDRLLYAKDGAQDVLTLVGNAAFIDQEHEQELDADILKVWLEATDTPGPPRSDQQRRKPHHLEASGNITSTGPDMHVHNTDRLVVWFKDQPPETLPRQEATSGDQQPQQPGTRPLGAPAPKPDGDRPGTPEQAPGAAQPDKPKKPIDLTARSILAHVLRSGEKNDLDRLWCDGAVHVHQDPATLEEKGVDIRGERLELGHHVDGNTLAVSGDHAQVQIDKIFILGPDVNIDQRTNEVFVKGMGIMKMPSNTKIDGSKSTQSGELVINWEKNMLFDGLKAQFFGNIRAEQDSGHLACQTMQVELDRKVSLREGNKTSPPAKVKHLLCDRDVWLEDAVVEGTRITSFRRLDCLELVTDNDDNEESKAEAAGPGRVRIFQLREKDSIPAEPAGAAIGVGSAKSAPTAPAKPKPAAGPAKARPQGEQERRLTQITFQGKMTANNKIGMATFYDRVVLIDVPTDDPDMKIDEDRPPKESMVISCEKLEALRHKLSDGTVNQEMRAYKKVVIEGDKYSGRADIVKYDQSKDQIILEGSAGNFAVLYKQEVKGGKTDTIIAKKITYWRSTGQAHGEDTRSLDYSKQVP